MHFNLYLVALVFFIQNGPFPIHSHVTQSVSEDVTVEFPNGGFETNPANAGNGWTWPGSDWTWDSSSVHSGSYSARVYRGSGDATESLYSALISVAPSTNYTLTYWLRTQSATSWPSVSVYQYTASGAQTGPRQLAFANIPSATSGWQQISFRFQTMPDAARVQIRAYLYSAAGTFWFDDFGLSQGSAAAYAYHAGFPLVTSGTIYYSSPTVADINHDGVNEALVASGEAVYAYDRNGAALANFPLHTGDARIQGQLAVGDLDGDGDLEIVAGTKTASVDGRARVFAWHHSGQAVSGWPKSVEWDTQYATNSSWVSTIVLVDLDRDGDLEIVAGTTNNTAAYPSNQTPGANNLHAWHANGTSVAGNWPNWYSRAGFYSMIAAGDMTGDGAPEVLVGRDHHYLMLYGANGSPLPGWPVETFVDPARTNYNANYYMGYQIASPALADLEQDGEMEFIAPGAVCGPGAALCSNSALMVMRPNGARKSGWEIPALGNGVFTADDLFQQAPALADLDRDGKLEIIVATNDGWIRAYRHDKSLLWAFDYTQGAALGASEPVVGDIDGDGSLDVLFGTDVVNMPDGIYYGGPVGLWALNADGSVKSGFPLAVPTPGIQAAPTLADFDQDGKLEILAATREGYLMVWDTPTAYDPVRLPWPTGRHDLYRTAAYTALNAFENSRISASKQFASQGETVRFTIRVASTSANVGPVSLTNTIPDGMAYVPGQLSSTSGTASYSGGTIAWSGQMPASREVLVVYDAQVTTAGAGALESKVTFTTTESGALTRSVVIYTNYRYVYLPHVKR